jgi:hypothetical protein
MDLVTIGLDVLLALLLVAALAYGVRLERKLKGLRDGQLDFVQSVHELDAAILRAETGLDRLRLAGEEARDGLHDRILKAREARTELERLIQQAERLKGGTMPAPAPVAARARPEPARPEPLRHEPSRAKPVAAESARPEPARLAPFDDPSPFAEPLRSGRPQRRPEPIAPIELAAERVASAILSLGDFDRLDAPLRGPVQEPMAERRREARQAREAQEREIQQREIQQRDLPPRDALLQPAAPARPARRPRGLDDDLFDMPAPDLRRGARR